jgi:hypothetical protein
MNVKDLQGKHTGERAFVIGNGPSLSPAALDKLTGEITIAVNRIAKIFPATKWRPTYYVGITTAVNDNRHKGDILEAIHSARSAVCWDAYQTIEQVNKLDKVAFVKCSHIDHHSVEAARDDWWSDDISKRLDKFGVSIFSALQVAAYMGFSEIYLLGCDGNYRKPENGKDLSHFDKAYRTFDVLPNYDYDELNRALLRAHEIAENASKRLGFKIYNCSPDSAITAHDKVSLESVL